MNFHLLYSAGQKNKFFAIFTGKRVCCKTSEGLQCYQKRLQHSWFIECILWDFWEHLFWCQRLRMVRHTLKILQQMLFFVWPLILSTWKKVAKTRFRKLCAVHTQGTFNDCETVRKLEHLIEKFIKIFMVLLFGKM